MFAGSMRFQCACFIFWNSGLLSRFPENVVLENFNGCCMDNLIVGQIDSVQLKQRFKNIPVLQNKLYMT